MSHTHVIQAHQRTARNLSRSKPKLTYAQWLAGAVRHSIDHDTLIARQPDAREAYLAALREAGETEVIELLK